MGIKFNKGQREAMQMMLSGENACLLGMAGTGKTEVVEAVCTILEKTGKKVKKMSYTARAARKIGGNTIYSVFRLPRNINDFEPKEKNAENLEEIDVIVIDEISTVSGVLMTIIGKALSYLSHHIQVIVVGDFYQLPPVSSKNNPVPSNQKYAFQSPYWEKMNFRIIELTEVVRQNNKEFIDYLAKIRCGTVVSPKYLRENTNPEPFSDADSICAYNVDVNRINKKMIDALAGEESCFNAAILGEVNEREIPGEMHLRVKVGMRVSTTVNTKDYINGDEGTVVAIEKYKSITVRFDKDGVERKITWYGVETDSKTSGESLATVMPLRPAYASTIHKSQGQTLEKVNIFLGNGMLWEPGQLYVALSHCKNVENMHIEGDLEKCIERLKPDPTIAEFYRKYVHKQITVDVA